MSDAETFQLLSLITRDGSSTSVQDIVMNIDTPLQEWSAFEGHDWSYSYQDRQGRTHRMDPTSTLRNIREGTGVEIVNVIMTKIYSIQLTVAHENGTINTYSLQVLPSRSLANTISRLRKRGEDIPAEYTLRLQPANTLVYPHQSLNALDPRRRTFEIFLCPPDVRIMFVEVEQEVTQTSVVALPINAPIGQTIGSRINLPFPVFYVYYKRQRVLPLQTLSDLIATHGDNGTLLIRHS